MIIKTVYMRFLFFSFFMSLTSVFGQNVTLQSNLDYKVLHDANLNDCWGYTDETGREYALVGTTKGTSIVDISNPKNPIEKVWLPGTENPWRDIQVWKDFAYVTTEAKDGLLIIDLRPLPSSSNLPTAVYSGPAANPWKSAHDVFIDKSGHAFICGANRGKGGVIILDLNNDPMNPTEVGVFDNWYAHDVYADGNRLYGAHIFDGIFSIVDISTISAPKLISTQTTSFNFTHNIWLTKNKKIAATTDEVSGAFVDIYDVSNENDIKRLDRVKSELFPNTIPHNTFILNDSLLITSYYADGFTIHDMKKPYNVVQVGGYDTSPAQSGNFEGAWGVYPFFNSGNIIISDIEKGLFVVRPEYKKPSYYEGIVYEKNTKNPINNVRIKSPQITYEKFSDVNGQFATGSRNEGTFDIEFFAPSYKILKKSVNLKINQTVLDTIYLEKNPEIKVHVRVKDAQTNALLSDVNVRFENDSLSAENTTNSLGAVDFKLYYLNQRITVGKWGYITKCLEKKVKLTGDTLEYMLEKGIYDDFSFDYGWSSSNSADLRTGFWTRAIPNGSNAYETPKNDADYDCGNYAFVTGNGKSESSDYDDIDGGEVTLLSPKINASSYSTPHLNLAYWYFSDYGPQPSNDTLFIELISQLKTLIIDTVLPTEKDKFGKWNQVSYNLLNFPIDKSDFQLQLRASDFDKIAGQSANSIAEAGLDFVQISNKPLVGVSNKSINDLSVFPVPFSKEVTIQGLMPSTVLTITDMYGKVILNETVLSNEMKLETSNWNTGIYIIHTLEKQIKVIKSN